MYVARTTPAAELPQVSPATTFARTSDEVLEMQGGAKGLIVNSTDLCESTNRAMARFSGQNGRAITLHPALRAACKKHPRNHNHTKRPR